MTYRFHIADVFTSERFGGNPLAVLPDAGGLDDAQMQAIAREFGFSETTFVLPSEDPGCLRRVRIFTPAHEVPFAGHPNIGTAYVLAHTGVIERGGDTAEIVFEERAGHVPVTVRFELGRPASAELTAPERLQLGEALPVAPVAEAIGLEPDRLVTGTHSPCIASVGLPFLCVEVADREALARSRSDAERQQRLFERFPGAEAILLYTRDAGLEGIDLRARMYAPLHGVAEDPATGSANCALAALLADCHPNADGEHRLRIAQGIEMGRPSRLDARVRKAGGEVVAVHIGGASVLVAEGELHLD